MPSTPQKQSRPNENRIDVVNKEVFRGYKKEAIKYINDEMAKNPIISKLIKEIIKTQNSGTPAKVETVVNWIKETFKSFELSKADWNNLLPIVIYVLFKSKYEIMLKKM